MKFLPDNRLVAWGTVASALLTAASLIGAGAVYAVRLRDDATASTVCDVDHESRLRVIEHGIGELHADVIETKTNVAWIRRFLDRPTPAKNGPQTAAN
ncbi:MAG: hypothetical protein ACLP9L_26130 [Thermoguttaceae bacterium]